MVLRELIVKVDQSHGADRDFSLLLERAIHLQEKRAAVKALKSVFKHITSVYNRIQFFLTVHFLHKPNTTAKDYSITSRFCSCNYTTPWNTKVCVLKIYHASILLVVYL